MAWLPSSVSRSPITSQVESRSRAVLALTLVACWLTLFVSGASLFVASPLLPLIARSEQVAIGTAGGLVTAFSLTYMLSTPWLGTLSDRYGRGLITAVGLGVLTLAQIAISLLPGLGWLLVGGAVAGGAAAAITPAVFARITDLAPAGRRGAWLALVGSGLLVALAVGAPLGGILGNTAGWQSVYRLLALLSIVLAVLTIALSWQLQDDHAAPRETAASLALTPRLLLQHVGLQALWSTSLYGVYTFLGAGLRMSAHLTTPQTAGVLLWYGLGAILGNFGGMAAEHIGEWRVMTLNFASLVVGFGLLALALAVAVPYPVLCGGFALVAAGTTAFYPAQQTLLTRTFPQQRGAMLAWNNSALYFGIALSSLLGGVILTHGGFGGDLATSAGLALVGVLLTARRGTRSATPRQAN